MKSPRDWWSRVNIEIWLDLQYTFFVIKIPGKHGSRKYKLGVWIFDKIFKIVVIDKTTIDPKNIPSAKINADGLVILPEHSESKIEQIVKGYESK